MASLSTDKTGPYLTFSYPRPRGSSGARRPANCKRYKVRLTGWNEDRAQWARIHVDRLIHAAKMARPVELATARWIQRDAPAALRAALAECGLIDDRRTLGPSVDAWLHTQAGRVSAGRLEDLERTGHQLVAHFGPHIEVAHLTAELVGDWFHTLTGSANTLAKRGRIARQLFRWLLAEKLIDANPATGLAITYRAASARVFVEPGPVNRMIDHAIRSRRWPSACALVLARYGGLRIGEVLRFRVSDVDWSARSFLVRDTKRDTTRTVPLFPEVDGVVEHWRRFADDLAPVGDTFPDRRILTRSITDLARATGTDPWPRLWHNLRASRESELLERYPTKDVLLWIGNSEAVAMKHYALTRDETFARAASEPTTNLNPKG
jgi:integrase